MKKISICWIVLFILLGSMLASACSTAVAEPVAALAATDAVTQAVSPLPTDVPPTAADTVVADAPTPSRIEFSVQNANMEIKVIGVEKPYHVYLGKDPVLGTDVTFKPGAGNMFLGLGIKVKNLTGSDLPMKWDDVYLTNKYGDKWYPVWGAYEKSNTAIDPLTIEILKYDQVNPDFDPDAHFYVGDNGYMRVIFQIPRDNLYYFFGLSDLPTIEINWRYY